MQRARPDCERTVYNTSVHTRQHISLPEQMSADAKGRELFGSCAQFRDTELAEGGGGSRNRGCARPKNLTKVLSKVTAMCVRQTCLISDQRLPIFRCRCDNCHRVCGESCDCIFFAATQIAERASNFRGTLQSIILI